MPLYKKYEFKDGGIIAVWKIDETEDELKAIASIPSAETEMVELTNLQKRRMEFYAVRALLNEVFEDRVYLGYEEDNSPYIKNSHHGISISHSGKYACIYVHENCNVGIDIECVSRNFDAVEQKILNVDELEFLTEKYRQMQLAIIWSAKEAIYKLMCERNVNFAEQIIIDRFVPNDDEGSFDAIFIDGKGEKHEFEMNYAILDDFEMVWVSL